MKKNILVIFLTVVFVGCAFISNRNERIKGDENYYQGKYKEALVYYEKVLQQDPGHRDVRRNMGSIYNIKKQYPKSIALFTKLVQEDPEDLDSAMGLGYAYFQTDIAKARETYLKILEEDDNHYGAHEQLGWVYYYEKNYLKAKEHFKIVQDMFQRNISAHVGLGWIAMTERNWKEAYEQFQALLDDYPDHEEAKKALQTIKQNYKPSEK